MYKTTYGINTKFDFTKMPFYKLFHNLATRQKYKFILAGGYVFNNIVNYDVPNKDASDIDIFFYDTDRSQFKSCVYQFTESLINIDHDFIIESKFFQKDTDSLYTEFEIMEVTIKKTDQKIQFINKWKLASPEGIINMFNIDYVKVYFDFKSNKLYCSSDALICYKTWACPVSKRANLNIKAMEKGMRLYSYDNKYDEASKYEEKQFIDKYKMCWLGIGHIDDDILKSCDFEIMWSYHPEKKSEIIMREKEIPAHRYLQSYLNTPSIGTVDLKKSSYMFSKDNKVDIPTEFENVLKHINNKYNMEYNQVVVNWYEDGNDYLPFHKDWTNDTSKAFYVTTVTFCEKDCNRTFYVEYENDKNIGKSLKTTNGMVITLGGMTNTYFTHGILKEPEIIGKRISLTFRYFEEQNNECESIKNNDDKEYIIYKTKKDSGLAKNNETESSDESVSNTASKKNKPEKKFAINPKNSLVKNYKIGSSDESASDT